LHGKLNKSKLNQILEDARDNVNELLDIETSELYEPYESIIKMYNKELEDIGYYLEEENQVALALDILRSAMKDKSEGGLYHAYMCDIKYAVYYALPIKYDDPMSLAFAQSCEEGAKTFLDRLLQKPDNET